MACASSCARKSRMACGTRHTSSDRWLRSGASQVRRLRTVSASAIAPRRASAIVPSLHHLSSGARSSFTIDAKVARGSRAHASVEEPLVTSSRSVSAVRRRAASAVSATLRTVGMPTMYNIGSAPGAEWRGEGNVVGVLQPKT